LPRGMQKPDADSIAGLGHLAIQYASKMGAEVVVFSTSKDKEEEARGFGALEFVLLSEPEAIQSPVDILVLTGSKYPDWTKSVSIPPVDLLRPRGITYKRVADS
jgi:D-arabinose 1-dehydrogenase-like Zn-dependent alcohol dehydrogenase